MSDNETTMSFSTKTLLNVKNNVRRSCAFVIFIKSSLIYANNNKTQCAMLEHLNQTPRLWDQFAFHTTGPGGEVFFFFLFIFVNVFVSIKNIV